MQVSCSPVSKQVVTQVKTSQLALSVALLIFFSEWVHASSFEVQKVNFEPSTDVEQPTSTLFQLNGWGTPIEVDLTENSGSIWKSIERGFSIPEINNASVQARERLFLQNHKALVNIFESARPFLHYITQECIRRGLPTELALLPFIESQYNPHAISNSDAVGLWQFMPSTGAHYQLKQNKWIDERKDLIQSTEAALDYLTYLYDEHGTWHLALIAYNWGPGAIAKTVKEAQAAGKELILDNLSLPVETQDYVPKLQAIKNIISHPEQFNFKLPEISDTPYFAKVHYKKDLDFRELSRLSNVELSEIKKMNPGLKQPILYAAQTDYFLIPIQYEQTIHQALKLYKGLSKSSKPFKVYKVKNGDTLDYIASEFKVSIGDIQRINSLEKNFRLKPGMSIKLPVNNPIMNQPT